MTELIELRPLKTVKSRRAHHPRSYTLTTAQPVTDSSEDESSSNDESPIVLNLQSKPAKRKNRMQTLPIIINVQPVKEKKKHIQQFVINTQPSPKKQEFVLEPIIRSPLSHPAIQYVPVSAPTIVERPSYAYQHVYTPSLIEERPYDFYSSYESPVRRIVRRYPSNRKSVHLPMHAKKLVNRFLSGMEHAHGRRYDDGSDSDHSIDDCRVCRRLRSAMDDGRRRSYSEVDLYRGSRVVVETHEPHTHKHGYSKNCRVCNLLEKGDVAISTIKDHSKSNKKKHGKQVHIVESFPSRIKPVEQTTTTTTTTQPNLVANNSSTAVSSVPIQPTHYPMSYTTYVDPNTGLTYAYDPNWQYDPSGTGMTYDYSSYYTNPAYVQSNPQYHTYNTTAPVVTDASNSTAQQPQQQQTQTTTVISPNPLVDTGTYTYMPTDRKKRKPTNKTVVVHTSRNPTPPAPNIIIEQSRPPRLPRKIQSTTVLKERTTQTPHTTTTTYIRT